MSNSGTVRSFLRYALDRLILRCEPTGPARSGRPDDKLREPRRMRARRLSCILRGSALRAEHLRMRSTAIVLAMPLHPSCGHERQGPSPRRRKKGGAAPKGACHPLSAPSSDWEGGRGSDPNGDRSPSGAPLRRLPRRANARTQPRPRFTRNTMRRRYLRLESRLSEAPRAPVVMPEGTMPGLPGSGVTIPARRNRTRPVNWLSPVDVPDVSETARLWSSPRQSQRLYICADESGRFARCDFQKKARGEFDSLAAINNSPLCRAD